MRNAFQFCCELRTTLKIGLFSEKQYIFLFLYWLLMHSPPGPCGAFSPLLREKQLLLGAVKLFMLLTIRL